MIIWVQFKCTRITLLWSWNGDKYQLRLWRLLRTWVKLVGLNKNASSEQKPSNPPAGLFSSVVMETDCVELQLSVRIGLFCLEFLPSFPRWVTLETPAAPSASGRDVYALWILDFGSPEETCWCSESSEQKCCCREVWQRCCCCTSACLLLFVLRCVVVKVCLQEGVCLLTVVIEVRRLKWNQFFCFSWSTPAAAASPHWRPAELWGRTAEKLHVCAAEPAPWWASGQSPPDSPLGFRIFLRRGGSSATTFCMFELIRIVRMEPEQLASALESFIFNSLVGNQQLEVIWKIMRLEPHRSCLRK